jgi:hypothetical protein
MVAHLPAPRCAACSCNAVSVRSRSVQVHLPAARPSSPGCDHSSGRTHWLLTLGIAGGKPTLVAVRTCPASLRAAPTERHLALHEAQLLGVLSGIRDVVDGRARWGAVRRNPRPAQLGALPPASVFSPRQRRLPCAPDTHCTMHTSLLTLDAVQGPGHACKHARSMSKHLLNFHA